MRRKPKESRQTPPKKRIAKLFDPYNRQTSSGRLVVDPIGFSDKPLTSNTIGASLALFTVTTTKTSCTHFATITKSTIDTILQVHTTNTMHTLKTLVASVTIGTLRTVGGCQTKHTKRARLAIVTVPTCGTIVTLSIFHSFPSGACYSPNRFGSPNWSNRHNSSNFRKPCNQYKISKHHNWYYPWLPFGALLSTQPIRFTRPEQLIHSLQFSQSWQYLQSTQLLHVWQSLHEVQLAQLEQSSQSRQNIQ